MGSFKGFLVFGGAAVLVLLLAPCAWAGNPSNNTCEGAEAPDVIVGDIQEERRWGVIGDVTSFSIGTYSCNVGDCWLNWDSSTPEHPVIGGNMYRLEDGRFEQIGQSWLKHGFFALSHTLCESGCLGTDGNHLGVNCADPYSAGLNGQHDRLGPKFEVNASTGVFPYPATDLNQTGDAIYKRLQVHDHDLDPTLNQGAQYFVEAQYVTRDDAAAGRQDNNASWRPISVFEQGSTGNFDIALEGFTRRMEPAIFAWQLVDPEVRLDKLDIGGDDGIYWVGSRVTDLGGDMWRYEYAIHNLNSHRSAREFRVDLVPGAVIQNIGFHDLDYHSGEPFDGIDWPGTVETGAEMDQVVWATETWNENQNANALRWGTLYNFRFEASSPPKVGQATLGLFRPGMGAEVSVTTQVPLRCNNNGSCESFEVICDCLAECVPATHEVDCVDAEDDDCDGLTDCFDSDCCAEGVTACDAHDQDSDLTGICEDCDDLDVAVWLTPSVVEGVFWDESGGHTVLHWDPPEDAGAEEIRYQALRSTDFTNFLGVTCLVPFGSTSATQLTETAEPPGDSGFYYLVRALNDCPVGATGSVGTDSDDNPREADCL